MKSAFALAFAVLLLAAPSALAARRLQQIGVELVSAQIAPAQYTVSAFPLYSSIPEFAADQAEFSTFELALNLTGLIDSVSDSDVAVTVFAPTNAAFETFLAAQKLSLEDLLDSDYLMPIIMYHIVPDVLTTNMMYVGEELPTLLANTNLTVAAATPDSNTVYKILSENTDSSAGIITNMNNIVAGMSLVQAVDAVLVPPMSVLQAVVQKADETTAA
ncbi:hypothetical protein WJX73_005565 [Symbiochloris irregularis]|uniref:FAS1 domain-containing protein n=1 Tax=Symbiochloris irregularis TaxID=706552 RepID=A0AAW1NU59_9CHLO